MSQSSLRNRISVLIHDLRGPVGVVRGHARFLLQGSRGALTEGQQRSLEAIDRQTTRMTKLIDEFQNVSDEPDVAPVAMPADRPGSNEGGVPPRGTLESG